MPIFGLSSSGWLVSSATYQIYKIGTVYKIFVSTFVGTRYLLVRGEKL